MGALRRSNRLSKGESKSIEIVESDNKKRRREADESLNVVSERSSKRIRAQKGKELATGFNLTLDTKPNKGKLKVGDLYT